MIVDESKFKLIPIDQLVKAAWNYKENNEQLTGKLIANIKRNGQVENLLVRKLDTGFFEVVNGNHRFEALQKLGAKMVMAYDLGSISDGQAYRIAIETNETKFVTDQIRLADLIKDISTEFDKDDLASTMPFNEAEIDNLIKMTDFDWNEFDAEKENTLEDDVKDHSILIQLSKAEKEAWQVWLDKTVNLHGGDYVQAFNLILALADNHTIEELKEFSLTLE